MKAIKVRLYPTNDQSKVLDHHFNCVRFVYNAALQYKIEMYRDYGVKTSKFSMVKELVDCKADPRLEFLTRCKAEVLQNVMDDIDTAYKNFFRGAGYPKFKSKRSKQSFLSKQNFKVLGNRLKFYGMPIHFRCSSRDLNILNDSNIKIKRITYSRDSIDNYYASILIDNSELETKPATTNQVGIDVGLKEFLVTSDGEVINNPRFLRKSEKRLAREQRRLSRKQRGSKNRNKQKLKVAKVHKKISNQRNDFLHKVSTKLIDENQVIVREDLNVKGMKRNGKLSKSISDVAWSSFFSMLDYKAKMYNRTVYKIDRFYPSSKTCSNCGTVKDDLTLKDRMYSCLNCKTEIDRDLNAAINILKYYREELPQINASGEQTIVTRRRKNI